MRLRRRRSNGIEWNEIELTIPDRNAPQPEQSAQQAGTQRTLWQAVGRLKGIYRDVILLPYGDDLSYDEIARALNINLGTVKSRLNAAHKQLQDILSGDDELGGKQRNRQRSKPLRPILLWLLSKFYAPAPAW